MKWAVGILLLIGAILWPARGRLFEMRWVIGVWLLINLAVVGALGFRGQVNGNRPLQLIPDMDFQAKYYNQDASEFFADGRAMRVPPKGTVGYGGLDYFSDAGAPTQKEDFLRTDEKFYEGKNSDGSWVTANQGLARLKTADERREFLARGRERFNIYCAVCHGAAGNGKGITTEYGMIGVANYHEPRIVNMSDGELYHTIVNGKGIMMPYDHLVRPSDRWAIIAYVRALQLAQGSQSASVSASAGAGANAAPNPNAIPKAAAADSAKKAEAAPAPAANPAPAPAAPDTKKAAADAPGEKSQP